METLGIGTKIFISGGNLGSDHIETIVRETRTMWITERDSTRIYKKDNSIVGASSYASVIVAKQEHFEKIERRDLIYKIRTFDFSKLDLETLRKIHALTKEA